MNTKLMAALILGSFVLAGCSSSGGSGQSASEQRIAELEEQVADLTEQAEQEQTARQSAEQQRQAAEQQAQAAERQRQDAEKKAAEALARASQADARAAITGLRSTTAIGAVVVTPRHGTTADVAATPTGGSAVSFASRSRSSESAWSITTLSNAGFTHNDDLVVYSNLGPATRVLLTQQYSARFTDSEPGTSGTQISATLANTDAHLIRSGSFPTTDGEDKTFPNNFEDDDTSDGLDSVRFSGSFHGASGHFYCTDATCTIGRRGNRYTIVAGTWEFRATDTARALVDDVSYMYFGWWKREQKSDEALSFQTFAGGMTTAHSAADATGGPDAFNALISTATYRGPAVGQYAIYQPLGAQSAAGSFTASVVLTANFDSNMLSGTITNFSNAADWSVTLNTADMAGGEVDAGGTVDWAIAGNSSGRQGAWTAEFFSEAPYVGQTPDGVVGQFTGEFGAPGDNNDVGRIAGAFGARK